MSVYGHADEMLLASPIRLEPDLLPCDRAGCSAMAAWLIPGASLCFGCAEEFGIGVRDEYDVPLDELVGDERWRRARRDEYIERVRDLSPLVRDDRRDRLLERIAEGRVEELLRDAGAQ